MKRRLFVFSLSAILLMPAGATYKLGVNHPVKEKNKRAPARQKMAPFPSPAPTQEDAEPRILTDLSKKLSIPIEHLTYYRKLHYGFEELVPSMVIARDAQVEIGRVLKMRSEGKKWQFITDYFSVDPSAVGQESEGILKPIRATLPEKALKEMPQKRG